MRYALLACLSLILWACADAIAPNPEPDFAVAPPGLYLIGGHPGNVPEVVAEKHFARLGIFTARLTEGQAQGLRHNPHVRYVEPDGVMTLSEIPWGLDRIDQRDLPLDDSYLPPGDGSGVRIYVVDSGIDWTHPEFAGRATFGFDAFGEDGSDCLGHGTHVSGIAAGSTVGVANGAEVVVVRIFACSGSTPEEMGLAAMEWMAGQPTGVFNMSWGGGGIATDDAVGVLLALGFAGATSAGNSDRDACVSTPARVPGVLTIGATTVQNGLDWRASWSNWGDCVDLFAPGFDIYSAMPGGYGLKSGTSMAAPHVTGVGALLWQSGIPGPEIHDSVLSFASKNRVWEAESDNAHMLYAFQEHDEDTGPPPDVIQLPAPDQTSVEWMKNGRGDDYLGVRVYFSWDGDEQLLHSFQGWMRNLHPDSTWQMVAYASNPGQWYVWGTSFESGGVYEVKTRPLAITYEPGPWSQTDTIQLCEAKNKKGFICARPHGKDKK